MTKALQCKVIRMETLAEKNLIENDLVALANQYLPDSIGLGKSISVEPLSGDAGFRRYFRLTTEPSVLGVSAAPEREDWVAFMRVSSLLNSLDVCVPTIYVADLQSGKLLIEDLGDEVYQDVLIENKSKPEVQRLYQNAIDTLHNINKCEDRPAWLPRYSDGLLRQEMELFPSWFVKKLLGYSIDTEEAKLINACFGYLVGRALDQPQVLVHRDYHCRNLLRLDESPGKDEKNPGVIDFQDAVWGPVTYDLVSLSRDCYVRWEDSRVNEIRDKFADQLVQRDLISADSVVEFPGWFEAMSAQRHLKVLGIFARLALRDDKTDYLDNLPLALRYLLEVCERDPEIAPFGEWIKSALVPLMEQQHWYIDWRQAGNEVTVW